MSNISTSKAGPSVAELAAMDAQARAAKAARLMEAGVTIFRPDTTVIDPDVEVGPDTVIEPFVQLLGGTRIGSCSHIRSFTVIENCTIGDQVLIRQSCILSDSTVASGAKDRAVRAPAPQEAKSARKRTSETSSKPRRRGWGKAPRPTT